VRRVYFHAVYYLSWVMFALGAVVLNLGCALVLLAPFRQRLQRPVRSAIQGMFRAWVWWLEVTGLVRLEWAVPASADAGPAVFVANHPSLLDATFILSRLPGALCIFKPAVLRNPLLAPAAKAAGYGAVDGGVDLIRDLAQKVAGGATLLIFPEGTRTRPKRFLNDLKPGFALIARRAAAPVRILVVQTTRDLLPRGHPWWRLPTVPSRYRVELEATVAAGPARTIEEIVSDVRSHFEGRLA
jgi:1-acyl-sn-glycerol-3-phosphate acyltransferase